MVVSSRKYNGIIILVDRREKEGHEQECASMLEDDKS